jgi:Tfp pilus assembly protein FimT
MRRALTLVELVMVITLTMILTAAALAGLRGVQTWRASATVRRVQADVDYARNLALASGRRTLCRLNAGGTQYEIQQEPTAGTGTVNAVTLTHPFTDQAWLVVLNNLAIGEQIVLTPTLSPPTFGFAPTGLVIRADGTTLTGEVQLTFRSGAVLAVACGSGLTEVRW